MSTDQNEPALQDARHTVHPEKPQRPIAFYLIGAVLLLAIIFWVFTSDEKQENKVDRESIEIVPDPTP